MKSCLPSYFFPFRILIVISMLLTGQLWAQDPAIVAINSPAQQLFANQETDISVTLENQSSNPAQGLFLQIEVWDANQNPVFFSGTPIPQMNPFQTIVISTFPNLWCPDPPGDYLIVVDIFAEVDQNFDNNHEELQVQAVPQPLYSLEQVNMLSPYVIPNSLYGVFNLSFPPVSEIMYVNVMAENPNNNIADWVVRNMPLLIFADPQDLSYWFDLSLLGFNEGEDVTNLNVSVRLDPFFIPQPFPVQKWTPVSVTDIDFDVPSDNLGMPIPLVPPLTTDFPPYDPVPPVEWVYRGCIVPNIDLDNGAHPANPNYAGDLNACGPAAAANSLQWLEDTHPQIPANGQTHRQKMEELSGMMGRGNGQGVTTQQLIMGKLAFIDKHKLPIHVKYQSWFDSSAMIPSPNPNYGHFGENKGGVGMFTPPTWEFLQSEVEKGEDVEVMFGWYDAMGNRHGGHWVTITGTFQKGDVKGVYIKDDQDQKNPGGTRQKYLQWVENGDWSRLVGFDGPNNNCWVESVVSESYDPNIIHDLLDISLVMVDWISPSLSANPLSGKFSFTFPPETTPRFVNIIANLPDSTPVWLIRNTLLPPFATHQDLDIWVNFGHLGWQPGQSFDTVEFQLNVDTTFYINPTFDIENEFKLSVDTSIFRVGTGREDFNVAAFPNVPILLPSFNPLFVPPIRYVYRGCTIPNIDLDSIKNNPTTVPGYAGDKNACGPAAAANSLQWLENTHPKIKANGQTHRQKLQDLSGLMNRANNSTVSDRNFIKGKLAFIDKHKLPIHVKFQSSLEGTDSIPSPNGLYGHVAENKNDSAMAQLNWDWIVSEMEKGEDVELGYGVYDSLNVLQFGHWVTLTGVSQVGGARGITIKDDADQDTTGGTEQTYSDWLLDDMGVPYLGSISSPNAMVRPEIVVSESYDPSITHEIFDFDLWRLFATSSSMQPNPTQSIFDFKYPPDTLPRYLNILANLPGSSNEVWLTRNVLLPPSDTTEMLSVWMDLGLLGSPFPSPPTVEMKIGVDTVFSVDSFFDITYEIEIPVDSLPFHIGDGAPDPNPTLLPPVPVDLPSFTLGPQPLRLHRGCKIPNIDLDSLNHNPTNTPGYAGDKNACGPAGAANSLQWLENENPNVPANGQTHRQKLEELSACMNRANNGGVLRENFIKGKLKFIDKHKLPIHVKFQGFKFNKDSIPSPDTTYHHFAENKNDTAFAKAQWSWLVQEMQNGEDVELEWGCYSNGVRLGGHWVTISGVTEVGGTRAIYFKHDIQQDRKGGLRRHQLTWVDHAPTGFAYLSEISSPDTIYIVETIVSESYDPNITFCPEYLTLDGDPIPDGTYEASKQITVSGRIAAGSDITLSAPEIVELIPGFLLEPTAILTTDNVGCVGLGNKPIEEKKE